jgi:small subunit ribosomal protein S20
MNKKQKNRKIVTQNKRNKMINRRYSSMIKTYFKLLVLKIQKPAENTKSQISELGNKLYSLFDKAMKKKVIHKNTASRKKSKVAKLIATSLKVG